MVESIHPQLKIYPSHKFKRLLNVITDKENIPPNIAKVLGLGRKPDVYFSKLKLTVNNEDLKTLHNIHKYLKENNQSLNRKKCELISQAKKVMPTNLNRFPSRLIEKENSIHFLSVSDIDWIYTFLQNKRNEGAEVPYLYSLLEGACIRMPENKKIERNQNNKVYLQQMDRGDNNNIKSTLEIAVKEINLNINHFQDTVNERQKLQFSTFSSSHNYVHGRSRIREKEHQD